jgi:TnpA family transposase
MKFGTPPPACSSPSRTPAAGESTLAKALHKYGRLVRTIYICRYLADEELRRRVRGQRNKRESVHALRRDLFGLTTSLGW